MPEYTLLADNIRENIVHFDPNGLFDNLHTIVHEDDSQENEEAEPISIMIRCWINRYCQEVLLSVSV